MKEAAVENHLRSRVKSMRGRAIKMNPFNVVGIPDRLVILPGGIIVFVELKRPKKGVLAKAQIEWAKWLRERGHWVETLWSKEEVDGFCERARQRMVDRA